ncbi:uncharacterized protein LOC119092896 [Pollicipes pollicipes]|uniref:uncharacterized protein LOC119092896 n=1 Tax=Pollicipes pollicipes TaxID=41117 RepID=UPI001884AC81|nr:uncharacterized protein LOC119092896 [Pollicipes pollicipes]
MPKSFSTGDIARLQEEVAPPRRSCSTWVAVGDLGTSSQLPSPQARQQPPAGQSPFSAADLVRAVNKKVRQDYIRRRLQTAFKALRRLSQSEFSLEQLLSGGLPASCTDLDRRGITVREVDRERGQPLTRYQRNMMVFNWLQTLDDDADELKVA